MKKHFSKAMTSEEISRERFWNKKESWLEVGGVLQGYNLFLHFTAVNDTIKTSARDQNCTV